MSIKETFSILVKNKTESEKHYNNITLILDWLDDKVNFYEWVQEKIIELSNKYTLFISTWNSDKFTNDILKKWWIEKCFDKILWSTYILKSTDHIQELINYTWDIDFNSKSIFIWDGQRDREIAQSMNIDFIHIWNTKEDLYEINSVININDILLQIETNNI
jgi:hypothetical protein